MLAASMSMRNVTPEGRVGLQRGLARLRDNGQQARWIRQMVEESAERDYATPAELEAHDPRAAERD